MQILSESVVYNIIGIIFALIATVIFYFKWRFTYWKRRGLYGPKPTIFFGNVKDWMLQKINISEQFDKFYKEFKNKGLKHGGIYLSIMPCYIPTDIELVKNIFIKDFQYFVNHGTYINEELDPLSVNLFSLEDEKWKNLRAKLTPTFTSGKMKMMFQTMVDCTKELNTILDIEAISKTPVDIKEIIARFTTNIIGSCAFGLDFDCFKDTDNNQFRKYGKRIFEHTTVESIQSTLDLFLPRSILKFFNFKANKSDVEKFFTKLVHDTVDYREKNHIFRKDFLHLLLQLKNRDKVNDDNKIIADSDIVSSGITMNELIAQCYVFFIGGYETTSSTVTFTLLELAQNLEIQNKLRSEINQVLEKHDGNLTYEACMEMSYLDKVINESLRKYPAGPVLFRMCNKDYKVPNSNICIEKGTYVMIPVMSIHYDPDYYPNPEKFDPERFNEENKQKRLACTFLPFGEGPRICIGFRFGLLQVKVSLITILRNYKITLNRKTLTPIKFSGKGFLLTLNDPIWLNIEKVA